MMDRVRAKTLAQECAAKSCEREQLSGHLMAALAELEAQDAKIEQLQINLKASKDRNECNRMLNSGTCKEQWPDKPDEWCTLCTYKKGDT